MEVAAPIIISGATSATGYGEIPTGFNFEQVQDVHDILGLTKGQILGIGLSCSRRG
jgi:hypothetical protein